MRIKLASLFGGRQRTVAHVSEPARFPKHNDIADWMAQKVAYYKSAHPDCVWKLFCPSMADYLPLTVHAAVSHEAMRAHSHTYLVIKREFPKESAQALAQVVDYCIYRGGPAEDYPIFGRNVPIASELQA